MAERDLLWMTAVVFLPSVFALLLIFVPRGKEEIMRWLALAGTGVTLGVSIGMFIAFYYDVIDANNVRGSDPRSRAWVSLDYRLAKLEAEPVGEPQKSTDWLSSYPWIDRFNINYYLGTDGISMPLVLMTTVLSFLAMIASWKIEKFVRGYCMLFLILETGMLGTFLALDFFLFYIFWEVMLLPMYFLIGVWGGPRREYAAIKFFLYTLLGSVFILIALLAFYFTDVRDFVGPRTMQEAIAAAQKDGTPATGNSVEVHTFDLVVLQRVGKAALQALDGQPVTTSFKAEQAKAHIEILKANKATPEEIRNAEARYKDAIDDSGLKERLGQSFFQPWFQYTMFLFLLVGFAIKVPVFPFHTWLPDAHVEAPTPISMILAGILLKLGGYGIIRIAYPICPWAAQQLAYPVALFGVINIVYGAFAAMAQSDFKKLVAYSSISHMGYVLLGIAVWSAPDKAQYWSWGMNGAMFQMIAHGITSAGMFFLVGVIYDRAHHRRLDNFRGLYEPMPLYGGISAVIFFAAMGLPGMCGFVGEFMVVLSTWNYNKTFAVLAALTVVITAAYILWTLQRVFMGENPQYRNYADINVREIVCITPLVVLSVALGVLPGYLLLNWMEPSLTGLVKQGLETPMLSNVLFAQLPNVDIGGMGDDCLNFLPELLACGGIVLFLLIRLFDRAHMGTIALVVTLTALGISIVQWYGTIGGVKILTAPVKDPTNPNFAGWFQSAFGSMVVYDHLTIYLRCFLYGFTALIIWLSLTTGIPDSEDSADFYCLLLGATVGMVLMASATHLLMVYIGVEMASLPSYALAGYLKGKRSSGEAALKYVVYGGGASGVMLYGISLLAGRFGTAYLPEVAIGLMYSFAPAAGGVTFDPVLILGVLFLMIGVGFKLAAVPFHFWCPDVFEGAAAEVAGFLSIASKGAALALLARLMLMFSGVDAMDQSLITPHWAVIVRYLVPAIAFFAALTATFGNLAAYLQTNLKRLLAYSTIAHAGYMMMGLAALRPTGSANTFEMPGLQAVLFYLVAYLFMNLGAFAVVAYLRNQTGSEELDDYRGLIRRSPWMVVTLSIFLLSLLGIPPLVGFAAKFQVFSVLWSASQAWYRQNDGGMGAVLFGLLVVGGINTVISAMYYIKVMRVMILEGRAEDLEGREPVRLREPISAITYSFVLALVVFFLGILWAPLDTYSHEGTDRFTAVSRAAASSTLSAKGAQKGGGGKAKGKGGGGKGGPPGGKNKGKMPPFGKQQKGPQQQPGGEKGQPQ